MTKNKKGFTIIEVVLVLAIAGLIFLMVFIALPALQRSQRNTRRRQDMARILTSFTDYASNNGGRMPEMANMDVLVSRYITGTAGSSSPQINNSTECVGDQFCDPDGNPYHFVTGVNASNAALTAANLASAGYTRNIYYNRNATCAATEGDVATSNGPQRVAIRFVLEGGQIYCGDNS